MEAYKKDLATLRHFQNKLKKKQYSQNFSVSATLIYIILLDFLCFNGFLDFLSHKLDVK